MEKICKNCQYFEPYEAKSKKGFGECNCPKFKYETSYGWEENGLEKDNFLYMDSDWYRADIEMGEEFGCVHFKEGKNNVEK